jgi:hypothetical protein
LGNALYSTKEGETLMFNVQRGEFGNTYKEESIGVSGSVSMQVGGGGAQVGGEVGISASWTSGTALPTRGSGLNVEQK